MSNVVHLIPVVVPRIATQLEQAVFNGSGVADELICGLDEGKPKEQAVREAAESLIDEAASCQSQEERMALFEGFVAELVDFKR